MKVKAMGYEYEPYVTLYLVPETDEERVLLRQIWEHGELRVTNGCADNTGQGYAIDQRRAEVHDGSE